MATQAPLIMHPVYSVFSQVPEPSQTSEVHDNPSLAQGNPETLDVQLEVLELGSQNSQPLAGLAAPEAYVAPLISQRPFSGCAHTPAPLHVSSV